MLRHGNGIQVWLRIDGSMICKYEGQWVKGEKIGLCSIVYPDGSQYSGKVVNGSKECINGIYLWCNGDVYEGHFRDDRMDGTGVFTPESKIDNKKEGVYRNNYYHCGGSNYVNPLVSDEESERVLDTIDNLIKMKSKTDAKFSFENVKSFNTMCDFIDRSNTNKRIPLVLATKMSGLDFKQVKQHLQELGCTIKKFDLRKAWEKAQHGYLNEYHEHIKKNLAMCMALGHYFFIVIDDQTKVEYKLNYDPDFKEYYRRGYLPGQLFDRKY